MAEQPVKKIEKLEHTEGGTTTRDDALDLGVPMLAGDPSEPVGPEDAFGPGPKRGDYSGLAEGDNYESVPVEDPKEGESLVHLVHQNPRAAKRGAVKGKKGGVETG